MTNGLTFILRSAIIFVALYLALHHGLLGLALGSVLLALLSE